MAEERMSVDEEVSSVSLEEAAGTASNSVETVASSNTSLNHSNDSFRESESEEEENSESESQWESSDDGDDNQGTELSVLLQALRAHKEVQNVLSSPIPSASQIVKDAETVHALLHKDFATARHPQVRPEEQNQLINLMTNITQQMENFQPEGSDIGPALHAARQQQSSHLASIPLIWLLKLSSHLQ
ncbi:uncharacterized protein LOC141879283 isoform X2 [Acropora palmata]|uniref:uncharacterized protein LOC141879283 isoform X2 n=1 Tax=Acropora palmata TaxID=6131 RepID=UPI003DA0C232